MNIAAADSSIWLFSLYTPVYLIAGWIAVDDILFTATTSSLILNLYDVCNATIPIPMKLFTFLSFLLSLYSTVVLIE